jgi:CRP-like cAMP-binding protein
MVEEQEYPDKKILLEENSVGDWVYVILEGEVKIKKRTKKGMITLATLGKGAIFGEMPLFLKRNRKRTATAQAHGRVRVGLLDTTRLDKEIESLSPQLRSLIKTLTKRCRERMESISEIAGE